MKIEKQQTAIAGFCNDLFFRNAEDVWCFMSPRLGVIEWDIDDLNACHEMEKVLTEKGVNAWWSYVAFINRHNPTPFGTETAVHATAPQRYKAFLRTLGLWEEEQ